MNMQRETDELEIEPGFILTVDLRIEFDYYGEPDDGLEFGEIWTTYTDWKATPRITRDGVRIDNRDDCKLIVEAAQKYILQDISDIHEEWLDAKQNEYADYKYQQMKDDRMERELFGDV